MAVATAACTAPNPDYVPPELRELPPSMPAAPGVDALVRLDLSELADLAQQAADLLPAYGAACDAGGPGCREGRVCGELRAVCSRPSDCCTWVEAQTVMAGDCVANRCCYATPGSPCLDDTDCCFHRGDGAKPHCASGTCAY